MNYTITTKQHTTYTSNLLPTEAVAVVIQALRNSFIQAHPDHQTPDNTDPDCIVKLDHFHACLRFAYHGLGVRVVGTNDLGAIHVGIWQDCEATGDLITIRGIGIVQRSYTARTDAGR